ncbi:YncE family protein [Pricia sp. S334]|uniref:YncE family protein n=1 Tax=Pricia mediterranea TaxID=3076079 RepID=A0ABU3L961_9FLAO|nr:DUF5074 domain-containing protein [Pricia sp. S334]MDT7830279.1 YncE family protein [Pricia sp. S334]
MRLKQLILTTAAAVFLLASCSNDDGGPLVPDPSPEPLAFENGIIVVNEGGITSGNASISFIPDDLSAVQHSIFGSANGVDAWGDTAQSMAFHGNLGFIVVNYSRKIEVVNRYTFTSVATIGGGDESELMSPRYMAVADGKGYVSDWGDPSDPEDDFVAVIDLENYAVTTKIPVGEGPERLLAKDNIIYVALEGGYNFNNGIAMIDSDSDTVTGSLSVGEGPNSLQLDADGNLWVLSGGKPAYTEDETAGQLNKIDTDSRTVTESLSFFPTEHPGHLSYEDGRLYYTLGASVFMMDVSDVELPEEPEMTGVFFYDMTVKEGKLYGADAKDFASNGSLEIYDLSDNSLITSKEVGVNPGAIYFNAAAGE